MSDLNISIVLPTYNVESYVERCILSLQNQTIKDFEMVFVDDCGIDSSIKIIKEYAKKDKRIKIVHHKKNLGTYFARKTGVENATGEYIVFLDPDDELDVNFLELLYLHIKDNTADIIFHEIAYYPNKKFYQATPHALPFSNNKRILEAIHKKNGKVVVWAGTPGKVYKKSFLLNVYVGLNVPEDFRYIYTEDKLLYYASLIRNPSYSTLKYKGYIYYNNPSSITNKAQLSDANYLIEQLQFTTDNIKKIIEKKQLTENEKKFFQFFLNNCVQNQVSLMRRYENNGEEYSHHVWVAFKLVPDIKQLIRLILYFISFKKIKI